MKDFALSARRICPVNPIVMHSEPELRYLVENRLVASTEDARKAVSSCNSIRKDHEIAEISKVAVGAVNIVTEF